MKNTDSIVLRIICGFLLGAFFLAGVAVNAAPQKRGPFEVTRVAVDRKSFNPSQGQKVTLSFEVTKDAGVQVIIYDRLGRQVRKLDMSDIEAGRHRIVWDGRTDNGKLPAGDIFLYVIQAKMKDGKKTIYNPARKTGGHDVKPLEYNLDRNTGNIEYVLPKACMIRMRAGLKDGMFAGTFFDWKPSTAGRHTYDWDGRDNSGQMYLLKRRDLDLRLSLYTLPDNTIIAKGQTIPLETVDLDDEVVLRQRNRLWGTDGKYLHYRHDPRICHQPRFEVSFPSTSQTEDGTPKVSGIVPVRVQLDQRDETYLINTRFEVMLFVDGIFIYEIEEGSSPFTFNWDTKKFGEGSHVVTVNLLSYDDHIGIVSRKVIIGD